MKRMGSSGYWEMTLDLPRTEHQFTYILEGNQRFADPTILTREGDDFGGENSVLRGEREAGVKRLILLLIIVGVMLAGCASHDYVVKNSELYLSLNKPEAKTVYFASSWMGSNCTGWKDWVATNGK